MSFNFLFDERDKIILVSFAGKHTDADLLDGYSVLRYVWRIYGPAHVMLDYTNVDKVALSGVAVKTVALMDPAVPSDTHMIAVAPQTLMFGLVRMFEGLASDTRRNFHVVHNMRQALDLIGVSRPSFKPVEHAA